MESKLLVFFSCGSTGGRRQAALMPSPADHLLATDSILRNVGIVYPTARAIFILDQEEEINQWEQTIKESKGYKPEKNVLGEL